VPVHAQKLDACALGNEQTGLLGAAFRRFYRAIGIRVPPKSEITAEFKKCWHDSEIGKIVIPDPKREGKILTAGYVRVVNIHRVIQRMLRQQSECELLAWPPNVPSSEVWIEFIEDKGGASTKLLLKFICCKDPNSVYHTVLLGMLDRVSDNYEFLKEAFGPLYDQISEISRRGLCVRSVWRQQLPVNVFRRNGDDYPMPDAREVKVIQKALRSGKKSACWRSTVQMFGKSLHSRHLRNRMRCFSKIIRLRYRYSKIIRHPRYR
jgi:hypothetical protein